MQKQLVKIINKSPFPLPTYATAMSAGLDLRADLTVDYSIEEGTVNKLSRTKICLSPGARITFQTGLYVELPPGGEFQIRPKSGQSKRKGITCFLGTIDSDYRGNIAIILHNTSSYDQIIEHGEKIAQMVYAKFDQVKWEEVEVLSETERGEGGFGHTGKF